MFNNVRYNLCIRTFSVVLLPLLGSGALSVGMPSLKCPLCSPSSVYMSEISHKQKCQKYHTSSLFKTFSDKIVDLVIRLLRDLVYA